MLEDSGRSCRKERPARDLSLWFSDLLPKCKRGILVFDLYDQEGPETVGGYDREKRHSCTMGMGLVGLASHRVGSRKDSRGYVVFVAACRC